MFGLITLTVFFYFDQERADFTWSAIGEMKDVAGELLFRSLSSVMLGILTIPHCNASCERIFSQVRKNKTDQRASLGAETMDALMVLKSQPGTFDPEKQYSLDTLRKIKSSYYNSLKVHKE